MLKLPKDWWEQYGITVLLVLLVASFWCSSPSSECRDQNRQNAVHQKYADYCSTKGRVALLSLRDAVDSVGIFAHSYRDDFGAMATVVIAVFTIVLATVTTRQVRLARDEFNSTHRAKIIVHAIEVAFDIYEDGHGNIGEPRIGASITYFNIGVTPAHLLGINAKITRRDLPLQSGIAFGIGADLSPLHTPERDIEPGKPEYAAVHSDYTLEGQQFAQRQARDNGRSGALVLIGKINYRDARGVERQTGFCRRLDIKSARWVPLEGYPEYEYAY